MKKPKATSKTTFRRCARKAAGVPGVRENSEDAREWQTGTFVPPTLIELASFDELKKEVFGPVLHVVRYNRNNLDQLIEQINASGYGLTLGVHTRIDETIAQVTSSAKVGNLYVNRNMVGAVVGVQPFGGEGLSGTGPKAGGPLYLYRLLANRPENALGVTLARQDAERPVDAQLKAVLTQPLEALITGRKNVLNCVLSLSSTASWRRRVRSVCCRGQPASATPDADAA
jgi:RHH-type proline utilization regulon transcriptional repressor/proline dehydrogenase/delta 1-pyrroline-5-carboxylate dehydrogenase